MARKKLQDLNLVDDFLFTSMLSYPGIGPKFIRIILGIILNRELGTLTVANQKVYPGIDTDKHGIRLDVYAKEGTDDNTQIYDMEPDKNDGPEAIASLPRRTRFYHALIDVRCLESGDDYTCLKDVTVIFITTYDPFGYGRMVYTVKTDCVEMPEMPFDDGARTLFLYIGGKEGNPPKELKELLTYLGDTRPVNAVNGTLKKLQTMVDTVKDDKEVSLNYMKVFEQERAIRERAIREGHQIGLEEGRKEGREEGRKEELANTERERQRAENAESRAENAESRLRLAAKIIRTKKHHPEWTGQQVADACGCTLEELDSF